MPGSTGGKFWFTRADRGEAAEAPKETPEAEGAPSVGRVKVIQGSVSIVRADGQKSVVSKDTDIHEGETVDSGKDGAAIVTFEGGNKLHVHSDTVVQVQEFKDPKLEASRRALLNLIKGKIRNQVEQKYNGKTSYYRIKTRGAVAGVRGTDFVVEHSEDKQLETKIETLKGKVILASLDETETREIMRGEGARFTADLPDPSFKDGDIKAFIKRGKLSPVYKISDEKMKELDRDSRVDLARGKKPLKEGAICEKPRGQFNQCAWNCAGNPPGEAKCRVDKPGVACVRQRCNGNGAWAEETRLPDPAAPVACPATGYLVKDCDY